MTDLLSKEGMTAAMKDAAFLGKTVVEGEIVTEVQRIAMCNVVSALVDLVNETSARREAAEKPFMYAISDDIGEAHFDEYCVSATASELDSTVDALNDSEDVDGPNYSVVALYRVPPLTSAKRERLNELLQEHDDRVDLIFRKERLRIELYDANERLAAYDRASKEPVSQYQCGVYNEENGETDWYDCDKGFYEQYAADRRRILYAAPPLPVVPNDVMPGGLAYSSASPKFEGNDGDKVVGYCCFISGETRSVTSQEQAYADARSVVNACRAAMSSTIPEGWALVPLNANVAMIRAGGSAAREYMEETGGNSPAVIYSAMLAAAPQLERKDGDA
ncbi:hypothetical protein N6P31_01170 [Pectobacterium betavasculorum]|uniref:hypothetical protein n=1 Tax=Pectobacterium betavasculorum TaxID=55207 RepID=UPI00313C494E